VKPLLEAVPAHAKHPRGGHFAGALRSLELFDRVSPTRPSHDCPKVVLIVCDIMFLLGSLATGLVSALFAVPSGATLARSAVGQPCCRHLVTEAPGFLGLHDWSANPTVTLNFPAIAVVVTMIVVVTLQALVGECVPLARMLRVAVAWELLLHPRRLAVVEWIVPSRRACCSVARVPVVHAKTRVVAVVGHLLHAVTFRHL